MGSVSSPLYAPRAFRNSMHPEQRRALPPAHAAEYAETLVREALRDGSQTLDLSHLLLRELPRSIDRLKEQLTSLNLDDNDFTEVPSTIAGFAQLEELVLSGNALTQLPGFLASLPSLGVIAATHNQLEFLPTTIGAFPRLWGLAVGHNRLTKLPDSISQLVGLRVLQVEFNELVELPRDIAALKVLVQLWASENRLKTLPEGIGSLASLKVLDLDENQLEELPESMGGMRALKELRVRHNGLKRLPSSLRSLPSLKTLLLHDNPALELPPEVLGGIPWKDGRVATAKPASILDYYFNTRAVSRPLNEAKLILVGRGGVGKTSLVNRLVRGTFSAKESKTEGIAITPWRIDVGKDKVRLNIWDFGGQEIMHATHRFFLTKRSLYLLVINAREGEQDGNVEYWLRMIESFGADSPVLVVINKIKDHVFDLNRRGLQAKFPRILGFIQTDCDAEVGLDELRAAIVRETDKLEHLRDPFPASWFKVKDRLAELPKAEGQNFIPFARYQEICEASGITEAASQETLVSFLHDLGIVVNFRDDPRLAETHVLNPEWVTNGIYRILNAETLSRKHGELRLTDLGEILDKKQYPRSMHLYLVDLMRKFELCYEFYGSDGHYLVPELLGKAEPDLAEFEALDVLRFEYRYNVIPEGLLPRFIVRARALNRDLARWRTGVVLEWEGNRALVRADLQDRRVSIVVIGPAAGRRRLLSVVRADLEHIHRTITQLQVTELVPVVDHPGLVVPYQKLQTLEQNGLTELVEVHGTDVVRLDVRDLLNGLEDRTAAGSSVQRSGEWTDPLQVAFSYSHVDEELRDRLETHLKLLQRQGIISTWHDRKIVPGQHWANVIDAQIARADVILALVSADFIASDYCYETEMQKALARHAKGVARVIPVILRACQWKEAPFGKLQALPTNAKPVTSWDNHDEAWNDVAEGIRNAVLRVRETVYSRNFRAVDMV
jgi:internalin A